MIEIYYALCITKTRLLLIHFLYCGLHLLWRVDRIGVNILSTLKSRILPTSQFRFQHLIYTRQGLVENWIQYIQRTFGSIFSSKDFFLPIVLQNYLSLVRCVRISFHFVFLGVLFVLHEIETFLLQEIPFSFVVFKDLVFKQSYSSSTKD